MKICQLLITNSTGGVAKHFVELTSLLGKSTPTDAVCSPSLCASFNDEVHTKRFLIKKWQPKIYITAKLYLALRKENYDIVHAHGNKSAYHLSKVKPFIRARCIATIHWLLKKEKERSIYKNLDAVIGVGEKVLVGIPNSNKYLINNGIPSHKPTGNRDAILAKLGIPGSRPVAIAIGRMVKTKGFDTLLHAWKGIGATLLLVGEGPQRQELMQISRELELDDHVIFAGQVDNAVSLFPAADLVIVSSIHEGFGYVIAEALIHQKPIISTAVDFARSVLPPEVLAPPSNAADLHKLIEQALSDIPHLKSILGPSYQWASQNLLLEHMVAKTLACYRQVLNQN